MALHKILKNYRLIFNKNTHSNYFVNKFKLNWCSTLQNINIHQSLNNDDNEIISIRDMPVSQSVRTSTPDYNYTEQICRSLEIMHSTNIISLIESEYNTLNHVRYNYNIRFIFYTKDIFT